ncbi:MAG: beta-N-acetylglucosaminidase domain-containing protein [Tissierellia bacterium]|nr:beta-N-acetylglucosaminidase domain-containing protein [Tissierellia bacterium]
MRIKNIENKYIENPKIVFDKIENNFNDFFEIKADDDIKVSYTSDRSKRYAKEILEVNKKLNKYPKMHIIDYADIEIRGVIEGFYGIPWNHMERKSLLYFMDKVRLNEYIYAPKDDPYHNIKWREKYDSKNLEKLKELSDISNNLDIKFTWAIHPGMNEFDFSKYEEDFRNLKEKYSQMIEIGIKSFALFIDDVNIEKFSKNSKNYIRLLDDTKDFLKESVNSNLLIVLPWYNSSWISDVARKFYGEIRKLDNIEVLWTGEEVISPLENKSINLIENLTNKKANIWFNWPVNDYRRNEVYLEAFEFFEDSDIDIRAFYSNPMNQMELSKISLYQIAKFLWDKKNYDLDKYYKEAFEFVDNKGYYLLDLADYFYGSDMYYHTKDKKYEIKDIEFDYNNLKDLKDTINKKISAIDSYNEFYENEKLKKELEPFLKALKYLLIAIRFEIDSDFESSIVYFEKSQQIEIEILKEYTNDELIKRKLHLPDRLIEIYDLLKKENRKC